MEIIELKAKAFDLINKQEYLKYQVDIVQKQIEEVIGTISKLQREEGKQLNAVEEAKAQ